MDENGIGELPQTQVHPSHKRYRDVEDEDRDYAELIATVERHTRCSTAYCLRRQKRKKPEHQYADKPKPVCWCTALEGTRQPHFK